MLCYVIQHKKSCSTKKDPQVSKRHRTLHPKIKTRKENASPRKNLASPNEFPLHALKPALHLDKLSASVSPFSMTISYVLLVHLESRNLPKRLLEDVWIVAHIGLARRDTRLLSARLVPFFSCPFSTEGRVEEDLEILEVCVEFAAAAGEVGHRSAPLGWVGNGGVGEVRGVERG
jgi:hypothetical protein